MFAIACLVLWSGLGRVAVGVDLPRPADVPAGPAGVAPPNGDEAAPPPMVEAPAEAAPAISAISETSFPDETLIVTGAGLEGASLRIWIAGRLLDVSPLRSMDDRLQAVVPTQTQAGGVVPQGTMLVWPVHEGRAGWPIRVNGATAWWAWPVRVRPDVDSTVRLFGKNLRMEGANPTLVLQRDDGEPQSLTISARSPYSLEAALPEGLEPGRYRLWAHNGTGGAFGWSEAVSVEVVPATPAPARVLALEPYLREEGDLALAIQAAAEDARRWGGAVLQLRAGEYVLDRPVVLPDDVAITLRGAGQGEWDTARNRPTGKAPATIVRSPRTTVGEQAIDVRGQGSSVEDLMLIFAGRNQAAGIRLAGRDQSVRRVTVVRTEGTAVAACVESHFPGDANHEVLDSTFHFFQVGVRITRNTDFVRVADCTLRGHFSIGRGTLANAVANWGGSHMIMERCDVRSVDRQHAKLVARAAILYHSSIRHCYLAHNRSLDVGGHSSVPGIDTNIGEQFLFHSRGRTGGVFEATAADTRTVTLDAEPDTLPQEPVRAGDWVAFIARGRGVGQWRAVERIAADGTITLQRPWRVTPEPGSTVILQQAFRHNIVYHNFVDTAPDPAQIEPDHKTVGVYWFHNCFDNITSHNTFRHVGVGVALAVDHDTPSAWNLVRENRFEHLAGHAGDAAFAPTVYSEYSRGIHPPQRTGLRHWVSVGNMFRANHARDAPVAAAIGWRDHERQWALDYHADLDRGLVMSTIEGNVFEQVDRGILLTTPSNWALVRRNRVHMPDADRPPWEVIRPRQTLDPLTEDLPSPGR